MPTRLAKGQPSWNTASTVLSQSNERFSCSYIEIRSKSRRNTLVQRSDTFWNRTSPTDEFLGIWNCVSTFSAIAKLYFKRFTVLLGFGYITINNSRISDQNQLILMQSLRSVAALKFEGTEILRVQNRRRYHISCVSPCNFIWPLWSWFADGTNAFAEMNRVNSLTGYRPNIHHITRSLKSRPCTWMQEYPPPVRVNI